MIKEKYKELSYLIYGIAYVGHRWLEKSRQRQQQAIQIPPKSGMEGAKRPLNKEL